MSYVPVSRVMADDTDSREPLSDLPKESAPYAWPGGPKRLGKGWLALFIFGSQSLAGAIERLIFVRTQVMVGLLILCTWGLSPLGGQSAVRLLRVGTSNTVTNGTVYYTDPSYGMTSFSGFISSTEAIVAINALYTASLSSSVDRKRAPRDLWDLPRIPRGPHGTMDEDQVQAAQNDGIYYSLLGIKIFGLNFPGEENPQYDFDIESSYFDFDCDRVGTKIPINQSHKYFDTASFNLSYLLQPGSAIHSGPALHVYGITFAANISVPITFNKTAISLNEVPPGYMLYATLDRNFGDISGHFALFNCSMERLVLRTHVQCGPSPTSATCEATRQKRVDYRYTTANFPPDPFEETSSHLNLVNNWRVSEGQTDLYRMSPTDNYLAGAAFPFSYQEEQNWTAVNVSLFSRRLTIAFNTYYQASLSPFNATNISFGREPSPEEVAATSTSVYGGLNSTLGRATTRRKVYRANRRWASSLLATSTVLEALALAGIALQFVVRGPDVLGFASSMTRDNANCAAVPSGGTYLDGPDRARELRHLRVQLADIYPVEGKGYIALRAVFTLICFKASSAFLATSVSAASSNVWS
ncbi:hypothetical protein EDB81DRAFT_767833 [Dactylonectria macrodidyma]|uniref:Uncharacterized protein n=1 Tax=Dactylonectria macrodidyma TaxID=307937 RepID=A0A9P9D8J5_9HYPO|nr:hypothetical protein EDB81DRAFT_767833 [Dactylonectria macrodidyma]